VARQAEQLEHAMMAGLTHEPVVRLSEKLVEVLPDGLDRCFYTDNGSSAIEAALKMSYHYWRNRGKNRKTRFIALTNSYHGETLGALSVGGVALYRETYEPLLMDIISVPSPDCFNREPGESWEDYSRRMFAPMSEALEAHHDEVGAVIVEPLVQCAGTMRMYHPVYLELLREACDEVGVHLIADEIAVGFGRTGTMFACEQAGITPDFMCLSKGLTGGYLPLAAVVTGDEVYQAFYDEYKTLKAFLHSHSYTGNPLTCSAALATLELFEEQNTIEHNRMLADRLHQAAEPLRQHPHIAEVRQHGMIMAAEMVKNKATGEPFDWLERRGLHVYRHGLKNEMFLRPLGNVIYFMPPYVITPEEIDRMVAVAAEGVDIATRD
jgi:adenosylmethionine-8-amino-7-oxononanoate aminotransferase